MGYEKRNTLRGYERPLYRMAARTSSTVLPYSPATSSGSRASSNFPDKEINRYPCSLDDRLAEAYLGINNDPGSNLTDHFVSFSIDSSEHVFYCRRMSR